MMTGKLSSSVATALLFGIAALWFTACGSTGAGNGSAGSGGSPSGAGGRGGSPAAGSGGGSGADATGAAPRESGAALAGAWRRSRRRCGGDYRARRRGRGRCRQRWKRRSGRNRGNGNGWSIRRNGRCGRRRRDRRCRLERPRRYDRNGRARRGRWQCGGRRAARVARAAGRPAGRARSALRPPRRCPAKRTSRSRWVRSCVLTCFTSRPATQERHLSQWCSISTVSVAPDPVRRDCRAGPPWVTAKASSRCFPNGVGNSWNIGRCCSTAQTQNVDDVGFVRAIIKQLQTDACIDPRRVYASGCSNGGGMSYKLACDAPT